MQRRSFILKSSAALAAGGLALAGCTTTSSPPDVIAAENEAKRRRIDAGVDATLSRLFRIVRGANELVGKARGVLVFPSVVQAGFVFGAQYGDGALRVDNSSVGYYNTVSGAFGALIGIQSKAMIFLFMTQAALDDFRNSAGWSVGGDASVALVKVGANGVLDTTTAMSPVEVIVLTNTGLMGDLSLTGTKVTRLNI
jgi:lipid-binding SYLF domain-containing protein